jgi:hypothetical protein
VTFQIHLQISFSLSRVFIEVLLYGVVLAQQYQATKLSETMRIWIDRLDEFKSFCKNKKGKKK